MDIDQFGGRQLNGFIVKGPFDANVDAWPRKGGVSAHHVPLRRAESTGVRTDACAYSVREVLLTPGADELTIDLREQLASPLRLAAQDAKKPVKFPDFHACFRCRDRIKPKPTVVY